MLCVCLPKFLKTVRFQNFHSFLLRKRQITATWRSKKVRMRFPFLPPKCRAPRFSPGQKLPSLNSERDTPKEGGWAMVPAESRLDEIPTELYRTPRTPPRRRRVSVIGAIRVSRFASCFFSQVCPDCSPIIDSKFWQYGPKGKSKKMTRDMTLVSK